MNRLFPALLVFGLASSFSWADTLRALDQADLFVNHTETQGHARCGTPDLLALLRGDPSAAKFAGTYMTLERPTTQKSAASAQGHFLVHYNIIGSDAPDTTDTGKNGIPDYVDSALVDLEYAWGIIIGLGYGAPVSDNMRGGSNAVDVYLQNLTPRGYYGYAQPDGDSSVGSSFMVIDNDFKESSVYPTTGYAALRITTAHEFFHVIHYSYYGGMDAVWWMEQCSVWMEDYAWDDVDDYLNYVGGFLANRNLSIDSTQNSYMYGATLFAMMIAKKYTPVTIRLVWNSFNNHMSGSIDLLDPVIPGGLAQAISDLGVWTYFTGPRGNSTAFFHDSRLFRSTTAIQDTIHSIPAEDSLACTRYAFKYIDLSPSGGITSADTLRLDFSEPDGGSWKMAAILYNSPSDYLLAPLAGTSPLLTFTRSFQKCVFVIANTTPTGASLRLSYAITRSSGNGPEIVGVTLDHPFPNPFKSETVIHFSVPETAHVRLRVVNTLGQTVAVLADEYFARGVYTRTFDAAKMASGSYTAILQANGEKLYRRMMHLK
jgi:hypothetical protein